MPVILNFQDIGMQIQQQHLLDLFPAVEAR